MSNKPFDIRVFCTQWLAAWTGNRPADLIKFYHPEVFYTDPARRTGLKGHAQLFPYLERLLDANPEWKWEVAEIIPTEKGYLLKWKAKIPVHDVLVEETGLDLVEIKDGLIIRNEIFFDRVQWMRALIG